MAEHEPSIGKISDWFTPKSIFNGLDLEFDLDPAHPGVGTTYLECRRYDVRYQTKGGGGHGNVDQVSIRTLTKAKALAELHHQKLKELIGRYGDIRSVPEIAWGQFKNELLARQQEAADETAPDPTRLATKKRLLRKYFSNESRGGDAA
jgi:hypothetical protein